MARTMFGDYALFINGVGQFGTAEEITLPELGWKSEAYTGGGQMGEREIGLILNKLEMSAKLNSYEDDILADALPAPGTTSTWKIMGSMIVPGSAEVPLKITVTGALMELKRDAMKAGSVTKIEPKWKDIIYYEEIKDGKTMFVVDLLNQILIGPDGVDRMAQRRRNIGR